MGIGRKKAQLTQKGEIEMEAGPAAPRLSYRVCVGCALARNVACEHATYRDGKQKHRPFQGGV
jgi:hypothetical protein